MRTFIKNNQAFACRHCGAKVPPHPTSSRDHCNQCLWSQHVDINPGDRQNPCQAMLRPVELEIRNGKTKIVYQCEKCSQRIKNIVAPDDDFESLLAFSRS